MSLAESESLQVVADPDRAATALGPDRRRLLAALAEAPDSATGLAARFEE
jgi:hypothetical protein